jgi:hypothetical protein
MTPNEFLGAHVGLRVQIALVKGGTTVDVAGLVCEGEKGLYLENPRQQVPAGQPQMDRNGQIVTPMQVIPTSHIYLGEIREEDVVYYRVLVESAEDAKKAIEHDDGPALVKPKSGLFLPKR